MFGILFVLGAKFKHDNVWICLLQYTFIARVINSF